MEEQQSVIEEEVKEEEDNSGDQGNGIGAPSEAAMSQSICL